MADECCCSTLACRTSAFANHEGQLTTRWSGPEIQRQRQGMVDMFAPGKACEEAIPSRSLVPAAQAQAARSR